MSLSRTNQTIRVILLISGLISFGLFLATGAIEIVPGANQGELATAAHQLGIAHPTGYPLICHLGHLFKAVPLGSFAYRQSLLAAVICSLAGLLTCLCMVNLGVRFLLGIFSCWILMIHPLLWAQATSIEVYGLLIFFVSGLFVSLARYENTRDFRWFLLSCFLFGLGLSNHLLIVFFLPIILCLAPLKSSTKLFSGLSLMIFGSSAYLYLPIRSFGRTVFHWGRTNSLDGLIEHISGRQFQTLMFSSSLNQLKTQINSASQLFINDWNWILILLALWGVWDMVRKKRKLLLALFTSAVLVCIFALNYQIHDITVYYLPVVWIVTIFAGLGLANLIARWRMPVSIPVIVLLAFLMIMKLPSNLRRLDQSGNQLGQNYAQILLASVPPEAILFYQGDNPMNTLSYGYFVENRREDIGYFDLNQNLAPFGKVDATQKPRLQFGTYRGPGNYLKAYPEGVAYASIQKSRPGRSEKQHFYRQLINNVLSAETRDPASCQMKAELLINSAEFECEHGDWSNGCLRYRQAAGVASELLEIIRYVPVLMSSRGLLREAIEVEESAVRLFPDDYYLLNNLAYHYLLSGKGLNRALRYSEKSLELAPKTLAYAKTLGRIQLLTGQTESAETTFQKYHDKTMQEYTKQLKRLWETNPELPREPQHWVSSISPMAMQMHLSLLVDQDLWHHVQFVLMLVSHNRSLSDDEIDLLVTSAVKLKQFPAVIQLLEGYLIDQKSRRIVLEKLLFLHRLSGNFSRIRELQEVLA